MREIDITKASSFAVTSINRASAFLAMGFRAISSPLPVNLALAEHSMIQFLPQPLPSELAAKIVNEFRRWIIGAALRELDAGYSLFLDQFFEVANRCKGKSAGRDRVKTKIEKQFSAETNVSKKLVLIEEQFGIQADLRSYIASVSSARNVLQHSSGIVRKRECIQDGKFVLTWKGFDVQMLGESTGVVESTIEDALREPYLATDPEGIQIQMVFLDRKLAFKEGEYVELSPHNLHEICNMYLVQAERLEKQLVEYADRRGLTLTGVLETNFQTCVEYVHNDDVKRVLEDAPRA